MKTKTVVIGILLAVVVAGTAVAQMGRGHMGAGAGFVGGPGTGPGTGPGIGTGPGTGYGAGGTGYGYGAAGGGGMMGNRFAGGYLGTLHPLADAAAAEAAFQAFIGTANGTFQVSELWEYATVYKAELSFPTGAKAFDLIADKFTGAVTQEMGMGLMLTGGYGYGLSTAAAARALTITPAEAQTAAQTFIDSNGLGYTLQAAETYPGYYKFHTTIGSNPASFGMDIMVNGHNGQIWMNTILGLPIAAY